MGTKHAVSRPLEQKQAKGKWCCGGRGEWEEERRVKHLKLKHVGAKTAFQQMVRFKPFFS